MVCLVCKHPLNPDWHPPHVNQLASSDYILICTLFVCTYTHINAFMHLCIYVLYVFAYMHHRSYTFMCIYTYVCMCIYMCLRTYILALNLYIFEHYWSSLMRSWRDVGIEGPPTCGKRPVEWSKSITTTVEIACLIIGNAPATHSTVSKVMDSHHPKKLHIPPESPTREPLENLSTNTTCPEQIQEKTPIMILRCEPC